MGLLMLPSTIACLAKHKLCLGLRCHFKMPDFNLPFTLPHLERAAISVQLAGKPYTEDSRLSGTMKMAEYYNSLFPELSVPYIFFSGKMYSNGVV